MEVYLSGDNFHSKYAGLIIKEYLPFCQSAINEVINGRMAESILIGQPENELSEYLFRRFSLTNMLLSGTSADSKAHRHFVLIVKSEIVRLMYASKDHVTFAEICRLLIAHPTCMPAMSRNFSICSLSIHAMSDFVLLKSDRENLNNYSQGCSRRCEVIGACLE
uniref:Ubiquitin carboxyl-terminal hydrolase 38-like N-terminal domain-containing protein n=1 Tax=Ciona savignyi TaxID=51511 RepID=H2Z7U0_CIOSA